MTAPYVKPDNVIIRTLVLLQKHRTLTRRAARGTYEACLWMPIDVPSENRIDAPTRMRNWAPERMITSFAGIGIVTLADDEATITAEGMKLLLEQVPIEAE